MMSDIQKYHAKLSAADRAICERLAGEITRGLRGAEAKVWHAHPVWFLKGNPIVGYNRQKAGIRLMFWSGADFDEPALTSSAASSRTHRGSTRMPRRSSPRC